MQNDNDRYFKGKETAVYCRSYMLSIMSMIDHAVIGSCGVLKPTERIDCMPGMRQLVSKMGGKSSFDIGLSLNHEVKILFHDREMLPNGHLGFFAGSLY